MGWIKTMSWTAPALPAAVVVALASVCSAQTATVGLQGPQTWRSDPEPSDVTARLNALPGVAAGADAAFSPPAPAPYVRADQAPQAWRPDAAPSDATTRLNALPGFAATTDVAFGSPAAVPLVRADEAGSPWVAVQQDVWREGEGHTDRYRLTRSGRLRSLDGTPFPPGAGAALGLDDQTYDLTYSRGWPTALARTASGLEVSLTPHAGIGIGSGGGSAEAGATLRIGSGLERLLPDGQDAFGDRPRWYVYAAGSGRAVGYNFARNRDGDFARSGYSHDSGAFIGDASVGLAMRRGSLQGSIGLVYREVEVKGLRVGEGIDDDVDEGMFAFQLSIKPE
jgi:hypothetical protein